jgi:hypothetical protein
VAKRRVREKRELIAESLEVSQTLRSCARSLRGSLLALQCVCCLFLVHEYSGLI